VLVDGLEHARTSPSDQHPQAHRRPPRGPDDGQRAVAEPGARR
jgi:hypothetical protein